MDRVGVLIVSKCLSAAAIVDAISRSEKYRPEFFVVEKQRNPFNAQRAKVHTVVPDLAVADVVKTARKFRDRVAFGLTDTEDFVVGGGRDALERETGIPMVCVSKEYAIEGSKAAQRRLFDRIFKGANPRYRVFDPKDYPGTQAAVADFRRAASELGPVVIKPDAPARGAGVGVWGSDFSTDEEAAEFFLNALAKGSVVVEEKVEGEESSFHAFSDGRHFVPAPMSRDYKRSFDGNRGPLTGGMGSYRGPDAHLPFIRESDWSRLVRAEERAFRLWKGRGSNPGLRGIVLYDAIMHTGGDFKVLERNSRGGNTEFINLLTTITDDFVDVCYCMLDGSLKGIRFGRTASVVTCAVSASYGIAAPPPAADEAIELSGAYGLSERSRGRVRVFPMDVRIEGGKCLLGRSRSVAVVGLGSTLEGARRASLHGAESLAGPVRWRKDIASSSDLGRSRDHLRSLRRIGPR
jgi:phosphoribosylamine--glycine ligase